MKFCCGVTLFYPSETELKYLSTHSKWFEEVFVFDNTDNYKIQKKTEEILSNVDNIIYYSQNTNLGLSFSLNKLCQYAFKRSYNFICLLDQDSYVSPESFNNIIHYIKGNYEKNVAIYVPEVVYSHKNENISQNNCINSTEVNWAITSGSFINLDIFNMSSGFDENYFIDRLDYDYCIHIRDNGYKIKKVIGTYLNQKLGNTRSFILFNISEHNSLRHYYIFRNRMYFYLKNSHKSKYATVIVLISSLKHFFKIILFENEKVGKILMLKRGYDDFQNKKMGKYKQSNQK